MHSHTRTLTHTLTHSLTHSQDVERERLRNDRRSRLELIARRVVSRAMQRCEPTLRASLAPVLAQRKTNALSAWRARCDQASDNERDAIERAFEIAFENELMKK